MLYFIIQLKALNVQPFRDGFSYYFISNLKKFKITKLKGCLSIAWELTMGFETMSLITFK
jgi:hypothetical protein